MHVYIVGDIYLTLCFSNDNLPPLFDLFHSESAEHERLSVDEECQGNLRTIIERINCDEDITEGLLELIAAFEGKFYLHWDSYSIH